MEKRRGEVRAHFTDRPKVVKVSPWLHFSKLADIRRHYDSCRHALLACCTFPNEHPRVGNAAAIHSLEDEAASELFEAFLTADAPTREKWGWNTPPPFLRREWNQAMASDARRTAAAKKRAAAKRKAPTREAPRGFVSPRGLVSRGMIIGGRSRPRSG